MKLVNDWRRIARRAWSVRLAVLSAVLSAAEMAIQFVPNTLIESGRFAAVAFAVSVAAAIARIVAQPSMRDGDKQ